ncbi:MAG: PASTA domain-containing protein [Oscillospiraceae bacterium]|nr:PASTA domain-containing protein [Oscillospiraceae bacterium]
MGRQRKTEYLRIRADTGQHRRVLWTALVLGILAFVPVGVRLFGLMVRDYDYYSELALRNQTRSTTVTADRGIIYDRNMNILACSQGTENIYLDPHELKQSKMNLVAIAEELAVILELDADWIVKQGQDTKMRYKQIAASVDNETASLVRNYINENGISGIHLEPTSQRVYPFGSLAAQVIGFTNASNTGSEGIEAAYDKYLSGSAGKVITTKGNNEMDMPFSYENYLASQDGCSVLLTLDTTVQACLENRLDEAIAKYDVQNGAFGMVMDVNTGEILAMATRGSYDPNDYQSIADPQTAEALEKLRLEYLSYPEGSQQYIDGKTAYENELTAARLKQWRNRCISDGYEPGSTFKVMTMAAALDSGAIDLDTAFYCRGSEQIPGRSQLLHCWRSTGHGAEKTPQALQNSCNVAFAHIGLKLGGSRFYSYIKNFGILEKTGIDLLGESGGVFFDEQIITNTDKWGTASLTSASFGQTFKLTPLQLVRGIAAVVNGGYLLEPYVVSEVIDANGNTVLKQEPTVLRQVISKETSATMCTLLESVVLEGTAKNASVSGFSIGGKTGTSEKIDVFDENGQRVQDKIVSFVGVAPMDDPQYIVLVALDTPSRSTGIYISGGVMAAPTVGAVMSDILPYLGVAQTEDAAGQLTVLQDMTGLTPSEAEKLLKEQNLTAVIRGTEETVSAQLPGAGENVLTGSQVILYCGEATEDTAVTVPDFAGMNRQQASQAAADAGLCMLVTGNTSVDVNVVVTWQSVAAGSQVSPGTIVELRFADIRATD